MTRAPSQIPQQEPFTCAMIIRAVIKALCLYVVFNLVYGAVQPVAKGLLPSLYNVLFPGQTRLFKKVTKDHRPVEDKALAHWRVKTDFNDAFIIDAKVHDRLIAEHQSSDDIIKPLLREEDLRP